MFTNRNSTLDFKLWKPLLRLDHGTPEFHPGSICASLRIEWTKWNANLIGETVHSVFEMENRQIESTTTQVLTEKHSSCLKHIYYLDTSNEIQKKIMIPWICKPLLRLNGTPEFHLGSTCAVRIEWKKYNSNLIRFKLGFWNWKPTNRIHHNSGSDSKTFELPESHLLFGYIKRNSKKIMIPCIYSTLSTLKSLIERLVWK